MYVCTKTAIVALHKYLRVSRELFHVDQDGCHHVIIHSNEEGYNNRGMRRFGAVVENILEKIGQDVFSLRSTPCLCVDSSTL